jgi:hypothetical protein
MTVGSNNASCLDCVDTASFYNRYDEIKKLPLDSQHEPLLQLLDDVFEAELIYEALKTFFNVMSEDCKTLHPELQDVLRITQAIFVAADALFEKALVANLYAQYEEIKKLSSAKLQYVPMTVLFDISTEVVRPQEALKKFYDALWKNRKGLNPGLQGALLRKSFNEASLNWSGVTRVRRVVSFAARKIRDL